MNTELNRIYPVVKGDQLCPLGFHPQVRWPTRCKRCFRDYKEHGNKRTGDDIAASTPVLSNQASHQNNSLDAPVRSWTSTQNLSIPNGNGTNTNGNRLLPPRPQSWASTPDLDKDDNSVVSVKIALPRRRQTIHFDEVEESTTVVVKRPPIGTAKVEKKEPEIVITQTDSLAERVRKMQIIKRQGSLEREREEKEEEVKTAEVKKKATVSSGTDTKTTERRRRPVVEEKQESPKPEAKPIAERRKRIETDTSAPTPSSDVQFLIQVKQDRQNDKRHDDTVSTTTETTETTLVDNREIYEELESMKRELDNWKSRCERAERDKSDLLLRRISAMDTGANRTAASEVLKLQQKVNEMRNELEDLRDDKRSLSQKVKELEHDLDTRPGKNVEEMLRAKLEQAESLCEELMDENEEMKKDLRNMEQEMDEMHDSFREDQADEYNHVKKELDQTMKNCRILSFKLKKCERKIEQLEDEKRTLGNTSNADLIAKINRLEEDLRVSNEVARRLQLETEGADRKKPPPLGNIGKSTSADGRITRASLIRSGSQEDPQQLLRDLQDSIEREADLREQLKFAEEEGDQLRAKVSRIEDENETLALQVKRMANKAKTRRPSPTAPTRRGKSESPLERDEGISDEEDPAELRLQLELNEQETSVLRRKIEDLEKDSLNSKKKIKELEEKLETKGRESPMSKITRPRSEPGVRDPLNEKKMQVMDDEISELRKKIIEKDRDVERLEAEMSLLKGTKGKNSVQKSRSLDAATEQQNLDIKRQLQVIEQEASVLRQKVQKLEAENEKLGTENKKMQLQVARSKASSRDNLSNGDKSALEKIEKERDELANKLKKILEDSVTKLPPRTIKKYTDTATKLQTKKMIEELEEEANELRALAVRCGGHVLKSLEDEKTKLANDLKEVEARYKTTQEELKMVKQNSSSLNSLKTRELQDKLATLEKYKTETEPRLRELEEKSKKHDAAMKQAEALKALQESQIKIEKDKISKLEKEVEKEKREKLKWETKVGELDVELNNLKKNSDKTRSELEREISNLKKQANDTPSKQLQELRNQVEQLESKMSTENKKYKELSSKYDLLEEEKAVLKVHLTADKENTELEVRSLRLKYAEAQAHEAKLKRENDDLQKRYLELQKALNSRSAKDAQYQAIEIEKNRMKNLLEECEYELSKKTKENEMNMDLASQLKREADDLRRKLDDFERINKAQRSMNDHKSSLEKEVSDLKARLQSGEMQSKAEVAATRLRYEQQANHLQAELASVQRQCERFKRDRDSFKQLLEAAQKTITDLKHNKNRRSVTSTSSSGDEDDKSKIASLEQQVGCLEDELSESRLEAGKLRTELVSEKSAADVKISELTSKLNEYEEERLLGSGRTKLTGTRTRLELSWQKEREDQQRLVQETATLARDLRQTLFEVERERDKERLEAKRKIDQIKKHTEEELDEAKRKVTELQSDLLELRDVHAKMRTANEKLRRDRDRYEKERDLAVKRRHEQDGERKVGALLQTVDELVKIAPELQIKDVKSTLPIPNPRSKSKSRSPSPTPPVQQQLNITTILARLAEASEELRRYQRLNEDENERERARRSGMRRAASTENDGSQSPAVGRRLGSSRNGSLGKKSLSLDQSMNKDQLIWKQDSVDSMSSMQSIDSEFGESRLSEASISSDMPRHRKKKRSLMGKLRASLSRTRGSDSEFSRHGSDSDLSLPGDRKKDLSKRISGIFKRAGSSSRANSVEKVTASTESVQRPVSLPPSATTQQKNTERKHLPAKPPVSSTTTSKPPVPNASSTGPPKKRIITSK